jgi:fumarate reductase subunit D
MIDIWNALCRVIHGMDDFEGFLVFMVTILFGLLFVRVVVALMMGRWNLF